MTKIILTIDCGTQSIRALIFSVKGELLAKAQEAYKPYYSVKPGWAEQDADVFWQGLCRACRQLKQNYSDLFNAIAGIGVTAQRASMVNLDQQGTVLRPVISWLDQRKARPVWKPNAFMQAALKLIGMEEAVAKSQTDGKCNWIMQNQPAVWEKTYKYMQISGFLNYRLTGEFKDSTASQIGHIPFNYKKLNWCRRSGLHRKLFPVEYAKLPQIVAPGETIGTITQTAALATGLTPGTPVIACGSDKGSETIGMGVVDQTMASLSFGTTATVQTTTKKYFKTLRFMPPYPAPIPGHYNPEVEIFRGFWMITWFKNEFAHKEVRAAAAQGITPEEVLNGLLKQAPAGSMGLMVQPYWGPGLKMPEAKGAMIGFGAIHKKAHIYRAVIEGLSYDLLEGLHKMEKAGKAKVSQLAVSGGASQSDEICQIAADVFNLPLVRGATFESSGLGAAIATSVGLGIHSSFHSAIDAMVTHERTFRPNPENVSIYRKLHERVYKKIYKALKPLYLEIREITGYPEK